MRETTISSLGRPQEAHSQEPRRALVLHDRQLVVDLITLTLNHGLFVVRAARNLAEAEAILGAWQPHMILAVPPTPTPLQASMPPPTSRLVPRD